MLYVFMSCIVTLLLTVPAFADPQQWRAEGWHQTDFSRSLVQWPEIQSGGPPKDGIPAIDDPKFIAVRMYTELAGTDPVVSIDINGDARTYPLRILVWHEIVNDVVGGTPVTITYCPLCNASLVFDRRVAGSVLDFGTTGKLRNSDLVMYDRQTESWWQQFTGEAILGHYSGRALTMLPARLESYADFTARHPEGKVMVPHDPSLREYGRNPYMGYDTSAKPSLYHGDLPDGIDPMARVVVVRRGSATPTIVALDLVRRRNSIRHDGFVVSWKPGQASAMDSREISKGRDVGSVLVLDSVTGLPAIYDVAFAFAAHAFYPDAAIITE